MIKYAHLTYIYVLTSIELVKTFRQFQWWEQKQKFLFLGCWLIVGLLYIVTQKPLIWYKWCVCFFLLLFNTRCSPQGKSRQPMRKHTVSPHHCDAQCVASLSRTQPPWSGTCACTCQNVITHAQFASRDLQTVGHWTSIVLVAVTPTQRPFWTPPNCRVPIVERWVFLGSALLAWLLCVCFVSVYFAYFPVTLFSSTAVYNAESGNIFIRPTS